MNVSRTRDDDSIDYRFTFQEHYIDLLDMGEGCYETQESEYCPPEVLNELLTGIEQQRHFSELYYHEDDNPSMVIDGFLCENVPLSSTPIPIPEFSLHFEDETYLQWKEHRLCLGYIDDTFVRIMYPSQSLIDNPHDLQTFITVYRALSPLIQRAWDTAIEQQYCYTEVSTWYKIHCQNTNLSTHDLTALTSSMIMDISTLQTWQSSKEILEEGPILFM